MSRPRFSPLQLVWSLSPHFKFRCDSIALNVSLIWHRIALSPRISLHRRGRRGIKSSEARSVAIFGLLDKIFYGLYYAQFCEDCGPVIVPGENDEQF